DELIGMNMKRLETDVVIFGGGTAGLAAAVTAAERGARVIVLEKSSVTGGTGNRGMGPLGVESRIQRWKKIPPTKEEAFKAFMDFTLWRVDARLVSEYIRRSGETIDWLESMGVEFADVIRYFTRRGYATHHVVKPPDRPPGPGASAVIMERLTEKAKELGVQIYLQTEVKRILKEDGRIVGVIAQSKEGEEIEVRAKAVIIATGGFGDNPEMIKNYTKYEWGKTIFSMRIPGMRGDGIRLAWEVGAARDVMTMEAAGLTLASTRPGEVPIGGPIMTLNRVFTQPTNLMVDVLGERCVNEEVEGAFLANAVFRLKDSCIFSIFDDKTREKYETEGFEWGSWPWPFERPKELGKMLEEEAKRGELAVFVANSLEELAEKCGIKKDTFLKTVKEYNATCEKGYDEVFFKNSRYLWPIKKPPFYAGKLVIGGYGSLGGIKINYKCEVLDENWEPIPGLYAAGVDACSIYHDTYVFILPGNTMGFALTSGRIAGENAVNYIKKLNAER
ncbi:MAG: FAD-dependent oxidoreductase, partial [Candidatus Bathyarchaeia archaeon]